jgi:acyl dehydratase
MSLDGYFRVGETVVLGSHTFEADEIKAFARKYDPQPFHIDEKLAENSVFGRLCASGWHTCSMWMKYNLEGREDMAGAEWQGSGPKPSFGPSPGFTKLNWLKPVYVGDTITFTRKATDHRAMASRPGWRLLNVLCEAYNQRDEKVLTFDSAVLVKTS